MNKKTVFCLFLFFVLSRSAVFSQPQGVTELLLYNTVRLEVTYKDGSSGIGSGFYHSFCEKEDKSIPVIVTNKHVINNASACFFALHLTDEDKKPIPHSFEKCEISGNWILHPDPNVDLAIFPIAFLFNQVKDKTGKDVFFKSFGNTLIPTHDDLKNLSSVENILMVGYPIGLWDQYNNFPIFRQGVTATHPAFDYQGKKEFLIDTACYPGSSGSPVLLYNKGSYSDKQGNTTIGNRVFFLGILYAGPQYSATGGIKIIDVPTKKTPIIETFIPTNLGCVIRSEALLTFEKLLEDKLK